MPPLPQINLARVSVFKSICWNVRQAIYNVKLRSELFSDFPKGCCRDASLVLAEYLTRSLGISGIYLCRREKDDVFSSHAWLLFSNLIIDITADQFGKYPEIIVTSRPYLIHKQIASAVPASFSQASSDIPQLLRDYSMIEEELAGGSITLIF